MRVHPRLPGHWAVWLALVMLSAFSVFRLVHRAPPRTYDPRTAHRANATLMMWAQNIDLTGVLYAVSDVEMRFNRRHGYPWVILGDQKFDANFKWRVQALVSGEVQFGFVKRKDMGQPPWIDNERASEARKKMAKQRIPNGESLAKRNLYRYLAKNFADHELMRQYRYYWRVEPTHQYMCDVDSDPFKLMEQRNTSLGFTITTREYSNTIRTLWQSVTKFVDERPDLIADDNMLSFLSPDGATFDACSYWSENEVADLDFYRSKAYSAFFDHLDRAGGFYYERWADSAVHSLGAQILLPKEHTHFFADFGFRTEALNYRPTFQYCPTDNDVWMREQCICDSRVNYVSWPGSCLARWKSHMGYLE
ncbi:glycosyltransferase family 15 protein [Peniophora sp. CONT]|nr:glycosyltransferase family 15 protein [Peniophora sp. CONT]